MERNIPRRRRPGPPQKHHSSSAAATVVISVLIFMLALVLLFGTKFGLPIDLMSVLFHKRIEVKASAWQELTSPASEGGFSVQLPGEPVVTTRAEGEGKTYEVTLKGKYHVSAGYAAFPTALQEADIRDFMNAYIDKALSGFGGKRVSDKPLLLGAVPGREIVIETDGEVLRSQHYVTAWRRYHLMVISTKEFVVSPDAERFFGSFTFLGGSAGAVIPPGWTEYSDIAGRFAVAMPGLPSAEQQNASSKAGDMTLFLFTLQRSGPNDRVAVQYLDYPEAAFAGKTPDMVLDNASTVDAYNVGGTVVDQKPLSLGAYPGREVRVENVEAQMRIRLYLVDRRLYKVIAMWPKSRGFSVDDERFLGSFRLTQ